MSANKTIRYWHKRYDTAEDWQDVLRQRFNRMDIYVKAQGNLNRIVCFPGPERGACILYANPTRRIPEHLYAQLMLVLDDPGRQS